MILRDSLKLPPTYPGLLTADLATEVGEQCKRSICACHDAQRVVNVIGGCGEDPMADSGQRQRIRTLQEHALPSIARNYPALQLI